ncbi:MAG: B12-binding domain-containing radical SAM protein [Breznakibacter sp.]
MNNNIKNNIILVTYDNHRVDYPTMSFSVASILATLKHFDIPASHYSFDIRKFTKDSEGYTPIDVIIDSDDIIEYLKSFSCIAFGITRWSVNFAYMLIKRLEDYKGKIVVGGYEITAYKEDHYVTKLITDGLNINHFIQGYAEKPLVKLMQGEYPVNQKYIREELDNNYLFSPYSSGVLNTYSRRIYWETKRGCTFNCGFCEWGNAQVGALSLNLESIQRDIEIFSKSNIEEINILDATFNVGDTYLSILKKLINNTQANITFQARFESLKPDFIDFCKVHKERLHLEFGLQTIHEEEMRVIGRKNNLLSIKDKLKQLNQLDIDYEVSIIYAIPGQTIFSFIDTIEFLRINGCKKIMAYPLQIPRNSELEDKRRDYKIKTEDDRFHVHSVSSCYSFTKEQRQEMDCIAFSLNHEDKSFEFEISKLKPFKETEYQYELTEEFVLNNRELIDPVISECFCRFEQYGNYLKSKKVFTIASIKGSFKVNAKGFLDYALGLTPYGIIEKNSKEKESNTVYYKTVIGQSGYVYVFKDFDKEILSPF